MKQNFNSALYMANYGWWDYVQDTPSLFAPFKAKNMSDMSSTDLGTALKEGSESIQDGKVSFRSIRQFRLQAAYKLLTNGTGILPWTKDACDVSIAFATISYLYHRKGSARLIDTLDVKHSFTPTSGSKAVLVGALDCFPKITNASSFIATMVSLMDAIEAMVPGTGELLSTPFFNACTALVDQLINSCSVAAASTNATPESLTLYKLANSANLLRSVVNSSSKGSSRRNVVASRLELSKYIDYTNWAKIVKQLWTAMCTAELSEKIRKCIDVKDDEIREATVSIGGRVIEMNTLKTDAFATIFEKEKDQLLDAISEYNTKKRHLDRIDELPEYLMQVLAADLLNYRKANEGEKHLIRVVLLSTDNAGAFSSFLHAVTFSSQTVCLESIDRSYKRLKDPFESACQVIEKFYSPKTYDAWAGCLIEYSDTNREQIIRRLTRDKIAEHTNRVFHLVKGGDVLSNVEQLESSGEGLATHEGFVLQNGNIKNGSGDQVDADGTVFSGDWSDLVEAANRLMGEIEFEINEEKGSVAKPSTAKVGYTIKPPASGPDIMSTGPTARREVDGREFRLVSYTNPAISSDLLFFVRHCDINGASLEGFYKNRLAKLSDKYVDPTSKKALTSVIIESEYIDPIVRNESNGAHFLQPYNDALLLPNSFDAIISSGKFDTTKAKLFIFRSGLALDTSYTHTFKVDPFYLSDYARNLINSGKGVLKSNVYKGTVPYTYNSKTNELKVVLFTDDNGQLTFSCGDSYKDDTSGKRLIYLAYSDPKLMTKVDDPTAVYEIDGKLVQPKNCLLTPAMLTRMHDLGCGKRKPVFLLNYVKNVAYTGFRCEAAGNVNTFFGVQIFDDSTAKTVLTWCRTKIDAICGDTEDLADYGIASAKNIADVKAAIDAYLAGTSTCKDLLEVMDPTLASSTPTDSVINPIIPITPACETIDKLEEYWKGCNLISARALEAVNAPELKSWFKPNYAEYLLRSIRTTLDYMMIYSK